MTLLYIYLTFFTIYFFVLTLAIFKQNRKFRDKYTPKDANLCVVVYATGKTDTLENLIKQLKNQNYPTNNYTIYAILDKCENVSEVTLQTESNVNVVNIDNLEPIGKSQAYSIIAEKLHEVKDLDAYVFLDSSFYVESDFLANVNFYLTRAEVFQPMINYLPQEKSMSFWQKVKTVYSRYVSKFIYISRSKLGFTNLINTDAFVIKKDILNKIANFDYRDLVSEVNYTLKLANEAIKVDFIDDINIYTSANNFKLRTPSLSKRLSILFHNFFKSNNFLAKEFLISQAVPNWLVFVLGYYILIRHVYVFPFMVSYLFVLITILLFALAFILSTSSAKLFPKEYMYLFVYPLYSIFHIVYNFPLFRWIRELLHQTTRKRVIETMTTDVVVSDGTHDFPCKMELISEDGLARVTFINKGKKYTTKNNHLRMIDAVRELSTKLADYGLVLKVCQCCKYYQPIVDGTTNMVKGCCNCQFDGRTPGDIIPTLIWNTCPKFEQHNVVNLF